MDDNVGFTWLWFWPPVYENGLELNLPYMQCIFTNRKKNKAVEQIDRPKEFKKPAQTNMGSRAQWGQFHVGMQRFCLDHDSPNEKRNRTSWRDMTGCVWPRKADPNIESCQHTAKMQLDLTMTGRSHEIKRWLKLNPKSSCGHILSLPKFKCSSILAKHEFIGSMIHVTPQSPTWQPQSAGVATLWATLRT